MVDSAGTTIESGNIEINVSQVLKLLVSHLYSGDAHITLRELVQNAHDALVERKSLPIDKKQIVIRVVRTETPGYLEVEDNGVGMDREDVRKNLCIVGDSGKLELARTNPEVIGRYGIGFMSSFIVADLVEVWSRKDEPNATLYKWETRDAKWRLETVPTNRFDSAFVPKGGTRVRLHFKERYDEKGVVERVQNLQSVDGVSSTVQAFCYLFPFSVRVEGVDGRLGANLNCRRPPWEDNSEALAAYRLFFSKNDPLSTHAFTVNDAASGYKVRGVLYFDNGLVNQPIVQLSVKRMLVDPGFGRLLPDYAVFCRGLVECPSLDIDLSRRHFNEYDPVFRWLREQVHVQFREAFVRFCMKRSDDLLGLWNKVDNSFTGQLLRTLVSEESNVGTEKKNAENFLVAAGPYLPWRVIDEVSGGDGRPRLDTIAGLLQRHRDQGSPGLEPGGRPTIRYTESKNALEKEMLLAQYGDLIDVSRESGNEAALMRSLVKNNDQFTDFRLDEVRASRFTALDPDDARKWQAVVREVQKGLIFNLRNHKAVVERFIPKTTPIIITDESVDQESRQQVREAITQIASRLGGGTAQAQLQSILESFGEARDQLLIHLNADHDLLKKLSVALGNSNEAVVQAARDGLMSVSWRAVLDYYGWGSTKDMLAHDRRHTQKIISDLLDEKEKTVTKEMALAKAQEQLATATADLNARRRSEEERKSRAEKQEQGEFVQPIVGFVDMVNSTRDFVARSATAPEKIAAFMKVLMDRMGEFLGEQVEVISFTGDGLLIMIKPIAGKSLKAGVMTRLCNLAGDLNQSLAESPTVSGLTFNPIQLRIALAHGDVFDGRVGPFRNLIGLPVVEAARIASDRELFESDPSPGGVLVTEEAYTIGAQWGVWGAAELEIHQAGYPVKGSNQPVNLYRKRVVAPRASAARGGSKVASAVKATVG